jgi:hypothetical protein
MCIDVRHRILLTSGLRMQIAATINDLQVTLSAEDLTASLSEIVVTAYWTCCSNLTVPVCTQQSLFRRCTALY